MDETIARHAQGLCAAIRGGATVEHVRLAPETLLEAVVARVRALAKDDRVRLVIKWETVDGRVRYRLRRRRDGDRRAFSVILKLSLLIGRVKCKIGHLPLEVMCNFEVCHARLQGNI